MHEIKLLLGYQKFTFKSQKRYLCIYDIQPLYFKINLDLIGWSPQPPRQRVPKINKIVDFLLYVGTFYIERAG